MIRPLKATSLIAGILCSFFLIVSCSALKTEKKLKSEREISKNSVLSPSFDCAKATTEVEKLICSDAELAELDLEMSNSYAAFMATLDEEFYRKKLVRKQHAWLGYRGKLSCFNTNNKKKTDCLKKAYVRRIENLSNWKERNNYDFWADFFDYKNDKMRDTRSNWDKIISELGDEYFVNCGYGFIYPSLPEEKVAFYRDGGYDLWPRIPKDTLGFRLRTKKEGDTLYIICDRYPIKNYAKYYNDKKKDAKNQKAFIVQEYPLKENSIMKQTLKEYVFDDTVFATSLEDLREAKKLEEKKLKGDKQCEEAKENIRNNFSKIEQLKLTSAKSIKELLSKINIPCSEKELREQFDNLKDYDGEISRYPIYGQYVYATDPKGRPMIGGTRNIQAYTGVYLFEMNEKTCELSSDYLKDAVYLQDDYFNFYINGQRYLAYPRYGKIISLAIKEKDGKGYKNIKDCVFIKEEYKSRI
ncbi:MAG: DUF1311 domain-containing protein [Alphaproteobacteria bacterium]|nr:DUF1311 domain-containing protein [Alphaproteobacteria bacterium]